MGGLKIIIRLQKHIFEKLKLNLMKKKINFPIALKFYTFSLHDSFHFHIVWAWSSRVCKKVYSDRDNRFVKLFHVLDSRFSTIFMNSIQWVIWINRRACLCIIITSPRDREMPDNEPLEKNTKTSRNLHNLTSLLLEKYAINVCEKYKSENVDQRWTLMLDE